MGFKEKMTDEEVRELLYKTMDAVSELSGYIRKLEERIETLEERNEEAFAVIDELLEDDKDNDDEDEVEK